MNEPLRPDPDELLAAVEREEKKEARGKLKIFFGMAAGVGKTYAMLQTAHQLKERGVDVVAGMVETHGRAETQELLDGLTVISRRKLAYRNVELEEMDLDAIIQRRPEYALVDELAHTNVEGSRHQKRYQDVFELLDHGINVYTTLNVQHVESLVDTVKQITGIAVHETVPDSVLDRADEIEVIDLPIDELLNRFEDGKVYAPERSQIAVQNFFRKGNLTALREIALRKTAERVGMDLQEYMQAHHIAGPWKTTQRLLVAVGGSPYSEQLIRWTRRLATMLEAPWIAVSVQTAQKPTEAEEKRLKQNIALARELGAELVTTVDVDIVAALVRVAREKNVTQIVVGKSRSNPFADLIRGGSLVNRLIAESGEIDVYVVHSEAISATSEKKPAFRFRSTLQQYLFACGVVIVVSALCSIATAIIDYRAVGMFLLFTVTVLALFVGRGPILAAAGLSAVIWNFFFIPPLFTFYIHSFTDALLVGMYFIIALVGGVLTARVRARELAMRHREEHTTALYALAKEINNAKSSEDILRVTEQHIGRILNARVGCFLPAQPGGNSLASHPANTFTPKSEKEWSVALWVYQNLRPAGRGTTTLPFAEAAYFPLLTTQRAIGVMGIASFWKRPFTIEEEGLLQTCLHQIAIAIEREILRTAAERANMLTESERLHKTLLNSISHELRTPISAILGASDALLDGSASQRAEVKNELLGEIHVAAERLNRLVENLLDMSRLESGLIKPKLDWCDLRDVINGAAKDLKSKLAGRTLSIEVPTDTPLVKLDFGLMERALSILLDNACEHTPPGSAIEIHVECSESDCVIMISDNGPGLPGEALDKIFEKFYRVNGAKTGGVGLGLSIARGFVEAHKGKLPVANREEGGARFTIRLPIK